MDGHVTTGADLELAERLTGIIAEAAAAIRRFGNSGAAARTKEDGSPVTAADEASEAVILSGLRTFAPSIPVISEEAGGLARGISSFFLVDPLDGTREYVAGRDEYTVNIALVRDGTPVVGLIAAPALHLIWRGVVGAGAWRIGPDGTATIRTRQWPARPVAAVSRSHFEAGSAAFLERLAPLETLVCGSALKFARLAEGLADVYPRFGPTCEWDLAAGHALVVAAGGAMLKPDGGAITYEGRPEVRIPGFIAWGDPKAAARRI